MRACPLTGDMVHSPWAPHPFSPPFQHTKNQSRTGWGNDSLEDIQVAANGAHRGALARADLVSNNSAWKLGPPTKGGHQVNIRASLTATWVVTALPVTVLWHLQTPVSPSHWGCFTGPLPRPSQASCVCGSLPSLPLLCGLPKGCLAMGLPALQVPAQVQHDSPGHPQTPGTEWLNSPPTNTKSCRQQGHSPLSCSPGESPELRWPRSRTLRRIPARAGSQVRAPQEMAAQDAHHTTRGIARSTAGAEPSLQVHPCFQRLKAASFCFNETDSPSLSSHASGSFHIQQTHTGR